MNTSRNNPNAMFRWTFAALLAATIMNGTAAQLSSREMKAVEQIDPVGITGRFLYFGHCFATDAPPVFVCELDVFRTGGSFLPLRFDGEAPVVCGDGVDGCYPFEWYRVRKGDETVDLAVLSARGFGDADDLRGFSQPRPISVFSLNGSIVRRTSIPGSFAELLLAPEFVSLEPVADWRRAQRRDDGVWIDEKAGSTRRSFLDESSTGFGNPSGMPTEADRFRLVALRNVLLEHFDSEIPETIMFVFDRNPNNEIVRAFIADSARPLSDGTFLWESFQWTERGWEAVPPEGVPCPSGKIPNAFHLSTSGFFVLFHQNDEPRLVALRSSPDGPVEPFWENALSDPGIVGRTRRLGIPDAREPPDLWSGVSMPPRSIAQSLYDLGRLRRLSRRPVFGLDVVSPFWEPKP